MSAMRFCLLTVSLCVVKWSASDETMSADEETGGSTTTVDDDEDIVAGPPWYTVWQLSTCSIHLAKLPLYTVILKLHLTG